MSNTCRPFHECEECRSLLTFTIVDTLEAEAARMQAAGYQNVRIENGLILFSDPDEEDADDATL